MAESEFLTALAAPVAASLRRKAWFSRPSMRVGEYLHAAQALFEQGLALGHLCRERLPGLVALIWPDQSLAEAIATLGKTAAAHLEQMPREPADLIELFFKPEAEALMKKLRDEGRSKHTQWPEFPTVVRKKLREEETLTGLKAALVKGIALGSHHPELPQHLFARRPNEESWNCARARLRYVPELPPEPRTLQAREEEASATLRRYLEEVRPDLLGRLGLWPKLANDYQLRLKALLARQGRSLE